MDTKELRGLMEAYQEVHASQEVDEAVKGADPEIRKAASAERRAGDKRLSSSAGKANADKMERDIKFYDKITKKTKPSVVGMTHEEVEIEEAKQSFPFKKVEKQMAKARAGSVYAKKGNPAVPNTTDAEKKNTTRFSKMHHASEKAKREKQNADKARRSSTFYKDTHPASAPKMKKANEELDIFDVVLEFLQVEGFAETLEEAEWLMANAIDEEAIDIILDEEQLDETIRNPESRKKLRAIMDREVAKGDKSKGQNPRKKYHTKTGNQAFSLLVKRDETDAPKAPVRKRGGTSAPSEERPSKSDRAQSAKYWAGAAGPSRDRGAGNRAARRAGKTVNDNRED